MRALGIMLGIFLSLPRLIGAAAEPALQAGAQSEAPRAGIPPSLAEMTPRGLVTMPVIGTDDETLGRVETVVRSRRTGQLEFVVKTDQGERLALEVGRIQAVDGQLRLTSRLDKKTLQQRIAAFDPDDFTPTANDLELARLAEQPPTG
ncbi:MAG TPA: hypothetical protein VFY81_12875 [Gammaproteobacteria bacterium]|nr:hypothetical protein [Gammaproteobacteria bacterium]